MAEKLPLVISSGETEQLQSGDVLTNVVYASSAFGTDELLLVSDGTGKDAKASAVALSTLNTAIALTSTNETNIATNAGNISTNTTNISTNTSNIAILVTAVGVNAGDIAAIEADYVSASSTFGVDESIVLADGTGRGAKASSVTETGLTTAIAQVATNVTDIGTNATDISNIEADYVSAASTFATDNVILRADGTSRGSQASLITIDDTGNIVTNVPSGSSTALYSAVINSVERFAFRAYELTGSMGVGPSCLAALTTGTNNVGFGDQALSLVEDGTSNVAFGSQALRDLVSGDQNFGLGNAAGANIETGDRNIAVGHNCLTSLISANNDVVIGANAARNMTGGDNVCVGAFSGDTITSGSDNVFIGHEAGDGASQLAGAANTIAIGSGTFTTANNQVVLGNTSITETILRGDITIEDGHDLVLDTTTGTSFGTAVTQKLSFYGVTPVVQPAAANQAALVNSTGGTGDGTLSAVGDTSSGDESGTINDNFTELHNLVAELRTALVNLGAIKGSS